jgi:PAS domain-containing protein
MGRSRPLVPASPGHASADEGVPHDAQVTLDSIGDAVLSTDLAGNITYLNPVAERMTG